ncbi:MAG TPA: esterase [Cytophagales bacterium]|nr:esterase [Cytophagales bacterium]HAA23821.1 esterase [Cytophagales bacterium]HAP64015.1 esterase [Cytophagales bacterium]
MILRIFWSLSLTLFLHAFALAQQSPAYLSQVGIPDSIYSEVLQESRTYWVHYPPGYQPESSEKYPVAILLDGEVWLPTLAAVHEFYSGGFMPEMILVGISNAENRTRDLTPTHIDTKYGFPFTEPNGGAEEFGTFLSKELIPHLESRYPITNYRTLIGHSYGGLFTTFMLLYYPEVFANYVAIDPSLDWDGQAMLKYAEANWDALPVEGKALYVALSGQLHMQDPTVTLDNVMEDASDFTLFPRSILAFGQVAAAAEQAGFRYSQQFFAHDLHGTIPVPAIRQGLMEVFEWFQMEQTDKFNSFETPAAELAEIVRYRADKLERHFGYPVPPYPEDLMNMSGYMSLEMGQAEKAKMFFELGLQYFPQSANTYDSMADYYEQKGDLDQALENVTRAFEISGSDYHRERLESLKERVGE